jgi:hypothetical protein
LTARAVPNHNRESVPQRFCRLSVTVILAPWLVVSAALAPEHVHRTDADHAHSLAHRHFASHHVGPHDQGGAEVEHGDARVVWLDDVGSCQGIYQLPIPDAAPSGRFELAPAFDRWIATPASDAPPAHGPPRLAHALRGPPSSARLI